MVLVGRWQELLSPMAALLNVRTRRPKDQPRPQATPSFSTFTRKAGGPGMRRYVTIPTMRSSDFEIIAGSFLTCLLILLYCQILPPVIEKHGHATKSRQVKHHSRAVACRIPLFLCMLKSWEWSRDKEMKTCGKSSMLQLSFHIFTENEVSYAEHFGSR